MEASAAPTPTPRRSLPPGLLRLANDERLVALVRDGHGRAFEALYDRHHAQILSFCRHMLGVREEAEDAVQQTFLSAYRDMVGTDKPIQLRAWLFTIARNRCLSLLRARRDHASVDDLELVTEGLATEVQRRQDLRDLLRDLARLPDDQRAALVLAEIGSLPHDEIADVLGCPRERVKALVFQARSSLGASREARETPCAEIREQLATLRGGALRRTHLRRHLRDCPGCQAYQTEVQRQRAAFAVLLPVLPTVALKHGVLAGAGLGIAGSSAGGAGAGATAGGLAAAGAKGLAVKALVVSAVVAGGAAGGVAVVDSVTGPAQSPPARTAPVGTLGSPPVNPPRSSRSEGFLPQTRPGPGGNGTAARRFAAGRGKDTLSPLDTLPGSVKGLDKAAAAKQKAEAARGQLTPRPLRSKRPAVLPDVNKTTPRATRETPASTLRDELLPAVAPRGKELVK